MLRNHKSKTAVLAVLLFWAGVPLMAQNDKAAGLFTTARDLPLVSQSLVVTITDHEALVDLVQVFANDGPDIGQADYRLPLPEGATVLGYGFWQGDEFLAAELKGKAQAVAAHQAAASEGKATGLSRSHRGLTQSFSVYPVLAGELKQVEMTLRLPVVSEDGRNHLRLPIERFLGRSPVSSTVVVHLETAEPIQDLGVSPVMDARSFQVTELASTSATMTLAVDRAVEIWWAEKMPAFLARAEAVAVDDGVLAWQLRLAFRADASERPEEELVVLVDGSSSLRRRGAVVAEAIEHMLARSASPVRVVEVGAGVRELTGDAAAIIAELAIGRGAFGVSWNDLMAAAAEQGCELGGRRCIVLTDPQVLGTETVREAPFVPLFLADSDELAYFATQLGPHAMTCDTGSEARGKLAALVDELVRPALVVEGLEQRGGTLELLPGQRLQVASGGYLRLSGFTYSQEPLDLELTVAGVPRRVQVDVMPMLPDDPRAAAVRRQAYGLRLDEWMATYRRHHDLELKQQIIALSVREGLPTPVTAFQVSGPKVLPSTGTASELLQVIGLLLLGAALLTRLLGRRLCS